MSKTGKTKFTVVVLGSGVGKSCITIQFVMKQFSSKYDPTVIDSYSKELTIESKKYTLNILDTAGQEEYSSMRDRYIREGNGFILVYSIIDKESFQECEKLFEQINKALDGDVFPGYLVGNKCDMEELRQVSKEDGIALSQKNNCQFMEVSAKSGLNVDQLFQELLKDMIVYENGGVKLGQDNNKQSKKDLKSDEKKKKKGCGQQ